MLTAVLPAASSPCHLRPCWPWILRWENLRAQPFADCLVAWWRLPWVFGPFRRPLPLTPLPGLVGEGGAAALVAFISGCRPRLMQCSLFYLAYRWECRQGALLRDAWVLRDLPSN